MTSFRQRTRDKLSDVELGDKLYRATKRAVYKRNLHLGSHREWERRKQHARQVKLHTLNQIDKYLAQYVAAAEARGFTIHFASTGEDAVQIALLIAKQEQVRRVIKGKSMATEEIGLNKRLEDAGIEVTETDLGELIIQLLDEAPSHITAPAIHKSVEDILELFENQLGYRLPDDVKRNNGRIEGNDRTRIATELTLLAREHLQAKFLAAEMGTSGANFLCADTGRLVLLENEANIRLSTTLPRVHVAFVGFDKLIARERDLPTFLKLLPVSSTGQRATCYVSLLGHGENRHVIIIDNGRSALLADPEHLDLLSCIRCGACSNICPVFRNIGGHGYAGVYSGPIGAALLPHLGGTETFGDLPFGSSLCGACSEICPVGIPIHERLLQWRQRQIEQRGSTLERTGMRAFAKLAQRPGWFNRLGAMLPAARGVSILIPPLRSWLKARDLPEAPTQSFAAWWRAERGEEE